MSYCTVTGGSVVDELVYCCFLTFCGFRHESSEDPGSCVDGPARPNPSRLCTTCCPVPRGEGLAHQSMSAGA